MISEYISKLTNNEKSSQNFTNYSLDGIRELLGRLGNPQNSLSIIHVAGTNGKGSVCHMTESILRHHGYKTGLYTSPHLLHENERIRVNSIPISNQDFNDTAELCFKSAKNIQITYFDFITAMAFVHFKNVKADVVVCEVGLGGRIDTTNVVHPLVSVITSISMDHTHILGKSLSEIAYQKAGIIKPNIPVVTSNIGIPLEEITREAEKQKSTLYTIENDFFALHSENNGRSISFDYRSDNFEIKKINIPHPGIFQSHNASLAIKASSFFCELDADTVRNALFRVKIPGRMEFLRESPTIIFDPAHNEESIISLGDTIRRMNISPDTVFISLMKDKNPEFLLAQIRAIFIKCQIIYVTLDDTRSFIPEDSAPINRIIDSHNTDALADTIKKSHSGCVLFTGSFRIYGTAVNVSHVIA